MDNLYCDGRYCVNRKALCFLLWKKMLGNVVGIAMLWMVFPAFVLVFPAQAQETPPKLQTKQEPKALLPFFSSSTRFPVEIESEQGVEWLREEKVYIAKGNAVVKYEQTTLYADELRAYYVETEDTKGPQVWLLEAQGGVIIRSDKGNATGARLSYDIAKGYAKFSGDIIEIQTQDFTLTAHKAIEFWNDKNLAMAEGGVHFKRGTDYLYADQVFAHFNDGGGPTQTSEKPLAKTIHYIEALSQKGDGHIILVSDQGIAQGNRGEYWLDDQLAKLSGNVKLTQGQNQLNGDDAEFDMKAGTAKVTSVTKQLVRGYFVPNSYPNGGLHLFSPQPTQKLHHPHSNETLP